MCLAIVKKCKIHYLATRKFGCHFDRRYVGEVDVSCVRIER